jgi:hypothetical protein
LLNAANVQAQIFGKWYLFEITYAIEGFGTETDYFVLKLDSAGHTFNLLNYSKMTSLKGNEYSRDKFVSSGSFEYCHDSTELRLVPASTIRTFEHEGNFLSDTLQNPNNKVSTRYIPLLNCLVFYIECDSSEKYKYPTGLFLYENMAALGTVNQSQLSFLDSTFFHLNDKSNMLIPSYTSISVNSETSIGYVVRSETNLNLDEFKKIAAENSFTEFLRTENFNMEVKGEKIILVSKKYSDFKTAYQSALFLEINGLPYICIATEEP